MDGHATPAQHARAPVPAATSSGEPDAIGRLRRARDAVRRAFREFLAVPTGIITAFVVLAIVADALDRAAPGWLAPAREFLQQHVFIDANTTSQVLAAVAAGIITVTSITVSVLLLAVQQSAASMSTAVFDQFLRRRENQFSFGYFIGLGLYTLITLATVHQGANAVLAATICVICTVIALYVLLVLLYSTVDQMRPSVVLGLIARLALSARRGQRELVARTRRRATPGLPVRTQVRVSTSGYVTQVNLTALERALACAPAGVELVLLVSIGSFVAFGDAVAELRGREWSPAHGKDASRSGKTDAPSFEDVVRDALHLETDRDIGSDPAYGIEQIETIGWTSISSAKSNPAPGLIAIQTVRDLIARWTASAEQGSATDARSPDERADGDGDVDVLPVVYTDDIMARAFGALESFGVAANESKQHQSLVEVITALSALAIRLPEPERSAAAAVIERLLPSVAGHIYTRALDHALRRAADDFAATGDQRVAGAIREAIRRYGGSGLPDE